MVFGASGNSIAFIYEAAANTVINESAHLGTGFIKEAIILIDNSPVRGRANPRSAYEEMPKCFLKSASDNLAPSSVKKLAWPCSLSCRYTLFHEVGS